MFFDNQLALDPESLAITDLNKSLTWFELNDSVFNIANFLRQSCGVQPNDHIALHIGNKVEFIEFMLAGILAGAWVTPINTHLTQSEALYILENCDARWLFHDDDNDCLKNAALNIKTFNVEKGEQYGGSAKRNEMFRANSPAGGTMLYTSGTTGKPKGVKRNKPKNLGEAVKRMQQGGKLFGLEGNGPHLVTGPLYHAAPMLFALYDLINGAPMVILPKWDNELFLETVEKFRVTTTHLVPTMFVRLLKLQDEGARIPDIGSLTHILHGAAPIARTVKQKMLEWWGDILVEYWGGSEAGVTTLIDSKQWRLHKGSVGKPLEHFEVYVGDNKGNPTNESEGPLFCRHKALEQVFEYYKDPVKTRKAHPQAHVFSIGDIGYVDSEGYVYLCDRDSNMIISGGVNIYPAEIEQALMEHPDIEDCAVYGAPNSEWGEEVHAAILLKSPSFPIEDYKLAEFLEEKIARYKIPRYFHQVASLPRTPTGKLQKHKLAR